MPVTHRLLAVTVAVLWGVNFVAIDAALDQFPPMLAVALRFAVIAVPTVLLVPRPRVPVRWLLLYGAGFGTLQFVFLYAGMAAGMPAGLASLVLQCSAPFTVLLGALLLREPLRARQVVGIVGAVVGLVVVGRERGAATGLAPFLLVVAGGLGWAFGNLGNRLAVAGNRDVKPLHLVLWMSVVPPLPMLAASLVFEGPTAIGDSLATIGSRTGLLAVLGIAYTVLLGTLLGSGLWTALMARHPAGRVAPYSMLVPVVGITAAWLLLDETPTWTELAGSALVVAGVLWASTRGRPLRRERRQESVVSTGSTTGG
ncbi:EamA family transporter [Xylanimonas cellulosilytica]|nr:EamA family transporter [Xylanimonas cellulosilytica]